MEILRKRASELLDNKTVQIVIGIANGTNGRIRPVFARDAATVEHLIYEETCKQNLAVYLYKPEIKKMGKAALVAPLPILRSVLQLAAEHQVTDNDVLLLNMDGEGKLREFASLQEVEQYVLSHDLSLQESEKNQLKKLSGLSLDERWDYWQDELSRCFKCYACRAACPMCYCSRCTVECNQPQWIPVPSHALGNLEWHINRAMHLAGRCVSCGACGDACPVGIPIHLLTIMLAEEIHSQFGLRAGTKLTNDFALSSFKIDDKEKIFR